MGAGGPGSPRQADDIRPYEGAQRRIPAAGEDIILPKRRIAAPVYALVHNDRGKTVGDRKGRPYEQYNMPER